MTALLVTVAVIVAGAVLSTVAATQLSARRERRAGRDKLFRTAPEDGIDVALQEQNARLTRLRHLRRSVSSRLQAALQTLQELSAPEGSGAQLLLRALATPLLIVVFGLSLLLNLAIFQALDLGAGTGTAMGVGVTVIELLLSVGLAILWKNREPTKVSWQVKLWAAGGLLVLLVAAMATIAPVRSTHAYAAQIAHDTQVLQQDEADPATNADPNLIQAQRDALEADRANLAQAQQADRAQAVVLPAAEALAGEWAIEGALALAALTRTRWGHARVRRLQRRLDRLDRRIARRDAGFFARLADLLARAGHRRVTATIRRRVADGQPRELPAGDAVVDAVSPTGVGGTAGAAAHGAGTELPQPEQIPGEQDRPDRYNLSV